MKLRREIEEQFLNRQALARVSPTNYAQLPHRVAPTEESRRARRCHRWTATTRGQQAEPRSGKKTAANAGHARARARMRHFSASCRHRHHGETDGQQRDIRTSGMTLYTRAIGYPPTSRRRPHEPYSSYLGLTSKPAKGSTYLNSSFSLAPGTRCAKAIDIESCSLARRWSKVFS